MGQQGECRRCQAEVTADRECEPVPVQSVLVGGGVFAFRRRAAQQAHEADPLIEVFIVACLGFTAFRVVGGITAKPACGLCAVRWAASKQRILP